MERVMQKFLFLAVLALTPALLNQAFAQSTTRGTGTSVIANESTKQKNAPPAKSGGLLNSDVTPEQARAKAVETNRRIAQEQKAQPAQR
jgi:hypothetical protein